MAAREYRETHYVEQVKKMVPLVTRETLFCWHVSKLVRGVNIFDLDLWFQVDSVEHHIKRNFVGSGHVCLIVALRPLIIILMTASLSSKLSN